MQLIHPFNWNEDSVLLFTTHGCTVILLGEYEDPEDMYFVVLEFADVLTVRSASTDCAPAFDIRPDEVGACFVAEVYDSNWDDEAHEKYHYHGTPKTKNRKHFVITNHDVFHEVLGASFSERKVFKDSVDFDQIKSAFVLSKAQLL